MLGSWSYFEFNSVPDGATIITGLTAADDIKDSADKILLENANQDDKIYMIIAACRRSDYDVILKGGSGADYLVNDSTKLAAFQKDLVVLLLMLVEIVLNLDNNSLLLM